jgi:hypothetical protein
VCATVRSRACDSAGCNGKRGAAARHWKDGEGCGSRASGGGSYQNGQAIIIAGQKRRGEQTLRTEEKRRGDGKGPRMGPQGPGRDVGMFRPDLGRGDRMGCRWRDGDSEPERGQRRHSALGTTPLLRFASWACCYSCTCTEYRCIAVHHTVASPRLAHISPPAIGVC